MWVYNNQRPHSSLGYLTPTQFLLKYGKLHQPLGGVAFPTFQQDAEFNWDFIVSNVTKEG
jgi:putative transposase